MFEEMLHRYLSRKNFTEMAIGYIRANCKNVDDLNKLISACETMLEELEDKPSPATLKQLMLQKN
jgi:hypothetical protein